MLIFLACKYLDRVKFWDHEVRVMLSRHTNIQMPSADSHKVSSSCSCLIQLFSSGLLETAC